MANILENIALQLREAAQSRIPCSPVRDLLGPSNVHDAYAIQKINVIHQLSTGDSIAGSKIGATSEAVQKQFGIYEPDFGMLFRSGEIKNCGTISIDQILQPKIEGEVAFVLKRDLYHTPRNIEELVSFISHAVVAIELLGSRIKHWDIGVVDTIADNASASHWVIGDTKTQLDKLDLVNCQMIMKKNGEIVSTGIGADSMGSPLNSMLWLVTKLIHLGNSLHSGDVILTGALGPVINGQAGDHFSVSITGLGDASVSIL